MSEAEVRPLDADKKDEVINLDDDGTNKPSEPEIMTKEQLKEAGFSAEEIKKAEELGRVKAEEPEKKEPEKEKEPQKKEEKEPEKEPEKEEEPPKEAAEKEDYELTPEEEKEFQRLFGENKNVKGLYWSKRQQKKLRQQAIEDRDRAEKQAIELKARLEELEKKIETAKQPQPEPERDEDGNLIDPDSKPVTKKQLEEMEAEKKRLQEEEQKKFEERKQMVAASLAKQEENAKAEYDDYADVMNLAQDIFQNHQKLFTGKQQKVVAQKIQDFIVSAANADKFGLGDYNVADRAYEIGKLHPKFGKPSENHNGQDSGQDRNGSRGLTPEKIERIEKNANRRSSSASISGSQGRRIVSPEDITLEDLNRMNPKKYREVRQKYPERVKELLNS